VSELSPAASGHEPILASFGNVSVTHHWVVTPTGNHPIRGTHWTVQDLGRLEEKISTTGIVLAILFVWFCLLGLLFLLMKDQRWVGWVEVTVTGPGLHHAAIIPASPTATYEAHQFVNYCRQLAVV